MKEHYRVISDDLGCKECGHGGHWTIASGPEGDETAIGTSWSDMEFAEDLCDLMNMAFDAGQEQPTGHHVECCKLASELCNAIDAAELDIGGHRDVKTILAELGPACDRVEGR